MGIVPILEWDAIGVCVIGVVILAAVVWGLYKLFKS